MITAPQALFMILFVGCFAGLIWLVIDGRRGQNSPAAGRSGDRDRIIEMMAGLDDRSSLAEYKRAYHISEDEIIEKRIELREKSDPDNRME